MGVMNMRGLPDDLLRRVKIQSAVEGVTMKQFVISALEKALEGTKEIGKSTRSKKVRKQ